MLSRSFNIKAGIPMDIPNQIETLHIDYEVTESPKFWKQLAHRLRKAKHDELSRLRNQSAQAIALYRTLMATGRFI